jgi:dipeptidyl aminopeptidase/acylaminoacyl peptidase
VGSRDRRGLEVSSFMRSPLTALLGTALAAAWSPGVEAHSVGVDDLFRIRTIAEVRISPDGERVAYVVSEPSLESNEHAAVLYVVSSGGGTPRRMTHATRIANRPVPRPELRWSPDGASISFLAYVDNAPQVVAMDADGGEPHPLTSSPTGVAQYEWSPDSKRLAFVASDPESPEDARQKQEKTFVIHAERPAPPSRLFVQEVGGTSARVVSAPEHYVSSVDWSPDGKTLAYSASTGAQYLDQWRSRIYTIPAEGGEHHVLVATDGMNGEPRYSPDGRWVAFISTGGVARLISAPGLYVVSASGGEPRSLGGGDTWVREILWRPDSRALYFVPNEATGRGGEHMFEQPVFRVDLEGSGKSEIVTEGKVVAFSASLSRDGKRLAFRSVGPRDAGDVVVMDLESGEVKTLTDVNPEIRELDLGALEAVSWKSFDGMEVWGLLLTPPAYRTGARAPGPVPVPLVVYVHGGPIGGFTYGLFPQFMHRPGQVEPYPVEAMASAGIAVLMPMPRGGSGYGLAGFRQILRSWGEGDYKDIMAGVDALIARGVADPDRLGVMGASYGGYMTDWIVTQTDRFKAASTGASICDIADVYYLSDAGDFTEEYFGLPWEERDLYAAHSPITYAARVTTPLLIQHGEEDRRVPVTQAKKFYKALQKLGKTVELEIYPRGGHVLYEPRLEKVEMERNLAWFEKWLDVGAGVEKTGR